MEGTGRGHSQSGDDGKLNSPHRWEDAATVTPKANHEHDQSHLPGSDTPHWFFRSWVFAAETMGFASALRSAGFQPAVSPTSSRRGMGGVRSAGFQPAVSPTSSRQGEATTDASRCSHRWRIGNPRYGRLEVCATRTPPSPDNRRVWGSRAGLRFGLWRLGGGGQRINEAPGSHLPALPVGR
jgi:hypothetical protein